MKKFIDTQLITPTPIQVTTEIIRDQRPFIIKIVNHSQLTNALHNDKYKTFLLCVEVLDTNNCTSANVKLVGVTVNPWCGGIDYECDLDIFDELQLLIGKYFEENNIDPGHVSK